LLVLLLLSVTIAAQSSALDPRHESHHAPGHCCLLCYTGPDFQSFHEVLLTASSSRAPPAA
jgi:hypothetical protein